MAPHRRYLAPPGALCDVCGRAPLNAADCVPGRWRTERPDPDGYGTAVLCPQCAKLSKAEATVLIRRRRIFLTEVFKRARSRPRSLVYEAWHKRTHLGLAEVERANGGGYVATLAGRRLGHYPTVMAATAAVEARLDASRPPLRV